jgi:basic amino acid/polyamine antiporter, APA family
LDKSKDPVFVREATGLVKEVSTTGSLLMNMAGMNVALGALTYTSAPYIFPGSNPVLATLIATGLCMFISLMYTLFVWAMPRSGGDYIFISRTIHPLPGFVANFNITFWFVIFAGVAANWVTTFALAPSILIIGNVTNNESLITLAGTIAHPFYTMVVGLVVIAAISALMIWGIKAIFTANNILFVAAFVGVAIVIGLLATNTNASFISDFDRYASYSGIITAAHSSGYSNTGPFLYGTLGVTPFIFGSTGYGILTAYWAGEIKSYKRNALVSNMLATAIVGLILALIGALAAAVFSNDFLGSITDLAYSGSSQYPFTVTPYLNLFVSILSTNPTVLWLLAATYVAAVLGILPSTYMVATRNIFAWSFDRVIPSKFSDINERFHTPVVAIGLVALINIVGLALYTYGPPSILSFVSGAGLAEILSLIVVALAAIVFPFVKKDLFERSPANIKLAGVPLISIAGTISLVFFLMIEYFYFTNSLYGANIPIVYEVTAFSIIFPAVIFLAASYYRKAHGSDLSLAFKELPPE